MREGEADPRELTPNPRNWRVHPKAQAGALHQVLERLGWVQRVIVNETTGHVLDGHLRVELALRLGEATVPVQYVAVPAADEPLVLATLDPLAAMAGVDAPTLADILRDVDADGELQQLLADLAVQAAARPMRDAEPIWMQERTKAMRRWGTDLGQVWNVEGRHQLAIGDSADPVLRSWVREAWSPEAVLADPEYDADAGDVAAILAELAPVAVVLGPAGPLSYGLASGLSGWRVRQDWVWFRRTPRRMPGRSWAINHHIWVLLMTMGKARLGWRRPWPDFGSVLQVEQEYDAETFSHAKATDLFVRLMAGFQWSRWCDPFLGGGTTILAGDHLGKAVVGIERDPGIAALALERFGRAGLTVEGPEPLDVATPPAAAGGATKLERRVRQSSSGSTSVPSSGGT